MNETQRRIVIVAKIALLLLALFPPTICEDSANSAESSVGHRFLFSSGKVGSIDELAQIFGTTLVTTEFVKLERARFKISWLRVFVELLLILSIATCAYFIVGIFTSDLWKWGVIVIATTTTLFFASLLILMLWIGKF